MASSCMSSWSADRRSWRTWWCRWCLCISGCRWPPWPTPPRRWTRRAHREWWRPSRRAGRTPCWCTFDERTRRWWRTPASRGTPWRPRTRRTERTRRCWSSRSWSYCGRAPAPWCTSGSAAIWTACSSNCSKKKTMCKMWELEETKNKKHPCLQTHSYG